jgi:hypothetical protein
MTLTRRSFLLGTTALAVLVGFKRRSLAQVTYPFVNEVTLVAPDIICVEIRDQPVTHGQIQLLTTPDPHPQSTSVIHQGTDPHTGLSNYYMVISADRKVLRWMDYLPTGFLDRTSAYSPTGWDVTNKAVKSIYVKTVPYSQGIAYSLGSRIDIAPMAHYIHLKLDSALTNGTYTISFPAATGLHDYTLNYSDKVTRCIAIRSTQHGYRRDDAEKRAYLSYFMPGYGTDGSINFIADYSVSKFHIIDANGLPLYEGTLNQRIDPTTAENSVTNVQNSSTVGSLTFTALRAGNPTTVTCPSHGFLGGESIRFRGVEIWGGSSWGNLLETPATIFTVAVVDPNTFTVAANSTGFPRYTAGKNLTAYDSKIDRVITRNRAATYVLEADFSSWLAPAHGLYRIYVPGIGVSDAFRIDASVWYISAQNSCGGYYNQLTGIALDGRFGYTRPVNYHPGKNGVTIYWSYLPSIFSSESGSLTAWPTINSAVGYPSTWISSISEPEGWGGFHDAGDWDGNLIDHAYAVYQLLMLGYVCYKAVFPIAADTNFGFPKSTELLSATTYAGTDYLPDAVHQVLYYADWFRRCQQLDGRVPAGRGYENGGGGLSSHVPSCYSPYQCYLYAADEPNVYCFAAIAAAIASMFYAESVAHPAVGNLRTLANTWLTAAKNAWNFVEPIYNSVVGDGGARDAYYAGFLDINTRTQVGFTGTLTSGSPTITGTNVSTASLGFSPYFQGWLISGTGIPAGTTVTKSLSSKDNVTMSANATLSGPVDFMLRWGDLPTYPAAYGIAMTNVKKAALNPRLWAAAALFRATGAPMGTGDSNYLTIIDPHFGGLGLNNQWSSCAAFEYALCSSSIGANPAHTSYIQSRWYATAAGARPAPGASITNAEATPYSYKTTAGPSTGIMGFSPGGLLPLIGCIFWAAKGAISKTYSDRAEKALLSTQQTIHGANQTGLCMTSGIGIRTPNEILIRDKEALGLDVPPSGYTAFGWYLAFGGGQKFFNWTSDSSLNFIVQNPAHDGPPNYGLQRTGNPTLYQWPVWETSFDNSNMIYEREFTTQQCIITQQLVSMWLHARGGNTATKYSDKRFGSADP